MRFPPPFANVALAAALLAAAPAQADTVTDWNQKTSQFIADAKLGTPPAIRVFAIVQTAAFGAARTADGHPSLRADPAARAAALDAAVAAAHRAALSKLLPTQQAAVEAAYQAALAPLPEGAARQVGVAAGERAAAEVLAQRADDGTGAPEAYRPHTSAGVYVPTAAVAIPQWSQRKPWLMTSAAQFRPGPPPALASEAWAREYNEVRLLGGRTGSRRSDEQTAVARFWDYSLPAIYHGVVRSVALQPGRDVLRNARLYAAVAQAMDDAMISVFDAKYHHHFWRPATAIRNGDIDGNDATPREAGWAPLIDAPMHPEYPSGHAILAGAVATVLKADVGKAAVTLSTASPTAQGATRRWTDFDDFVNEVSSARIWGGIHFRSAVEVGAAMGRRIGELAATRLLQAPH